MFTTATLWLVLCSQIYLSIFFVNFSDFLSVSCNLGLGSTLLLFLNWDRSSTMLSKGLETLRWECVCEVTELVKSSQLMLVLISVNVKSSSSVIWGAVRAECFGKTEISKAILQFYLTISKNFEFYVSIPMAITFIFLGKQFFKWLLENCNIKHPKMCSFRTSFSSSVQG